MQLNVVLSGLVKHYFTCESQHQHGAFDMIDDLLNVFCSKRIIKKFLLKLKCVFRGRGLAIEPWNLFVLWVDPLAFRGVNFVIETFAGWVVLATTKRPPTKLAREVPWTARQPCHPFGRLNLSYMIANPLVIGGWVTSFVFVFKVPVLQWQWGCC